MDEQAVSAPSPRPAPARRRWRWPVVRSLMRAQRRLRRRAAEAGEAAVDWAFRRRALALLLHRDHVLCLGDSHVAVMNHVRVPGVWFRAKPVSGATASGVRNPQSTSQAMATFEKLLAHAPRWQEILLDLGEVDCGFLIWHRAKRRGLGVEEQLEHTLDTYAAFIADVAARGFKRTSVLSVALPTIGDDPSEWGEVASLRRVVTASQSERTELTLRYNELLRDRCDALGVPFIDATSGHRNPVSGLVDASFLRDSHHDHHLADGPYSRLIERELRPLWGARGAGRAAPPADSA